MAEAHLRLCLPGALEDVHLVCRAWWWVRRGGQHWGDTCKSQQRPEECTWVIRGRSVEVEAALRGARAARSPAEVLTAVATLYPLTPLASRPHPKPHYPSPAAPTLGTPSPPPVHCPRWPSLPRFRPHLIAVTSDVEITELSQHPPFDLPSLGCR